MEPVPLLRGENRAVVTADPAATHGKSNDAGEVHQPKKDKHVDRRCREFRECLRESPKPE
jgi:hypothetical protein